MIVWIITKQWPEVPESEQPATQQHYPTRKVAIAKMRELRKEFPNRKLRVKSVVLPHFSEGE